MSDKRRRVKSPGELSQDPRRLRRRRIASAMTLKQAAAKIGCSESHLSELENGKWSARPATLASLADAYGCRVIDLMPREEDDEPSGASHVSALTEKQANAA